MFRCRTVLALAALCVSLVAPPAATATPVALITAFAYTYAPGDADTPEARLLLSEGGRLMYTNADPLGYHSIVSYDTDERGDPIFFAPLSGTSELNEVRGVASLAPGRYRFYCDVHGSVMDGVLEVTPSIT